MNKLQPCKRADLECYLRQPIAFTVTDSGHAEHYVAGCEYENTEVDEYTCRTCGLSWEVQNRYDRASVAQAWEQALAHLGVQESAA